MLDVQVVVMWRLLVICSATLMLGVAFTAGDSTTLRLVQVLHRHGDRTPLDPPYPNDPYQDRTYWPSGYEQLTNTGKRQLYELGQYLRTRYSDFLDDYFYDDYVRVRSTDYTRTIMSTSCLLAALYPPADWQVWNGNLSWQPIPIHTVPLAIDDLLWDDYPCPAREAARAVKNEEPFILAVQENLRDLYAYLTLYAGKVYAQPDDVHDLKDTFLIEQEHNLTLPDWTNVVMNKGGFFYEKMQFCYDFCFMYRFYTHDMRRFYAGLLLNDMIGNMNDTKNEDGYMQLYVYSAHDTNIAALLSLFDLYYPVQPPTAAAVLLELHYIDDDYVVQLYYRNSTDVDPHWLSIPNCGTSCPLSTFITLSQDLVISDMYTACKLDSTTAKLEGKQTSGASLFGASTQSSIITILVLMILNSMNTIV